MDVGSTVYLVVPCYNEEEALPETIRQLSAKLSALIKAGKAGLGSRILFVDDGSRDKTWKLIDEACRENPLVCGIKLAHNRGHQNALLAGLMAARERADCAISMDADLQDDVDAVDTFLERYYDGCDIVYGVRSKREQDTAFKRGTAQGFYQFMRILGVEIIYNHADYRLMSRRALEALSEYEEVNLFLRGIIPQIGYPHDIVYYERRERVAGQSKYPLKKMLQFALEGVTSFSIQPLKLISNVGIAIAALSVVGLLYAFISYLMGVAVPGWTAIVGSVWLLGGIEMFCIGVVGVYIGKIYSEVKGRPRYRIETERFQ